MPDSYPVEELANINLQTIVESNNSVIMADALKATVPLLKTFDGNPNHLEAFVNIIDTFYNRYYTGDISQKEFVNLAIQSKLVGEANNFLLTRPDLITWPVIKDALRLKFGDPISRQNLTQQLMFSTKQKNETTLEYVDKLKTLVHRITSKIQSETLDNGTKLTLIQQTELTATHNLMSNVPQELRTILIIQDPKDLTTAVNSITNYEMINNQLTYKNQFSPINHQIPANKHMPHRPRTTSQSFAPQPAHFPRQPIQIEQKSNFQRSFPTNRQVFGKPQDVFKPSNNTNFPKPTPMSGVSVQPKRTFGIQNQQLRPTNHPQPSNGRNFNNHNPNYTNSWRNNPHASPLVFQEITHLEDSEEPSNASNPEIYYAYEEPPDYQNYQGFEEIQPECDYEQPNDENKNFLLSASENQHLA